MQSCLKVSRGFQCHRGPLSGEISFTFFPQLISFSEISGGILLIKGTHTIDSITKRGFDSADVPEMVQLALSGGLTRINWWAECGPFFSLVKGRGIFWFPFLSLSLSVCVFLCMCA